MPEYKTKTKHTSLFFSSCGSSHTFSNSVATSPTFSYFFDVVSYTFKTLGCRTSFQANQILPQIIFK